MFQILPKHCLKLVPNIFNNSQKGWKFIKSGHTDEKCIRAKGYGGWIVIRFYQHVIIIGPSFIGPDKP